MAVFILLFCPYKTRCDALCRTKFPINCDTHLVESFFQTGSDFD
ncbi:MAG: DUF6783 domain-containing protein [Blautia sp.]